MQEFERRMDQNKQQGTKRERHTKEDKKEYKKRRKLRLKQDKKAVQVEESAAAVETATKIPKPSTYSRAHTIVKMAVTRNPRSTFLTPNLRSAILPSKRSAGSTLKAVSHQPKTTVPELDRSMLSAPDKNEVFLGEGTYGVTRFMHFNGNFPVAVKEFKMNNLYEVKKEAGITSELQREHHPNLPYVLGVCVKEKPYLMVTQFYGKSKKSFPLNRAIEYGIIEFDNIGKVFKQIVDAINCLHEAGWLHNDIKENNVLMHKTPQEWKPVVIDFGKCRSCSNPKRYELTEIQKTFYKAKHAWIAPELIGGTHVQSPASDVFSLGFLLQKMLCKFVRRSEYLESVSNRCLARHPDNRISLKLLLAEL